MKLHLYSFLPIIGGIYGSFLGAYMRSDNKSPKTKRALQITGIFILVIFVASIIKIFIHWSPLLPTIFILSKWLSAAVNLWSNILASVPILDGLGFVARFGKSAPWTTLRIFGPFDDLHHNPTYRNRHKHPDQSVLHVEIQIHCQYHVHCFFLFFLTISGW